MDTTGLSSIILSFPFSYTFAGGIHPTSGEPYSIDTMGYYWENEKLTATTASLIRGGDTELRPAVGAAQKRGYSVRFSFSCIYLFREAYHFIESGETARSVSGSGTIMNSFPFTLPYSGQVEKNGGTISTQGLSNLEWTNYTNASGSAIDLWIKDEFIKTRDVSPKNYGWTVRSRLILFREAYHFIESGENEVINRLGVGSILLLFPFTIPYSSSVFQDDGIIYTLGIDSVFWTTRIFSTTDAYNLYITDNDIVPQGNYTKRSGFSVRYVVNRTDTTQRDKFISSPYNFPYSGYYLYGGGVSGQGSYGRWWSRSSFTSAGQAYRFGLNANGRVSPQDVDYVGVGFAVRCVGE